MGGQQAKSRKEEIARQHIIEANEKAKQLIIEANEKAKQQIVESYKERQQMIEANKKARQAEKSKQQMIESPENFEKARKEIITTTKSEIEILQSLRDGTKEYDFLNAKIIKESSQAIVIEIESKIDGKTYWAKKLKYQIGQNHQDRHLLAEAEQEIRGLRSLKHPMIQKIIDIIKDKHDIPCIIMEQCNQSLANIIKGQPEQQLIPEKYILRIFTMICIPLYYIHKNGIVHCDLRPENILQKFIGDKEIFLIAGFGSSKKGKTQFIPRVKKSMTPFHPSIEELKEEDACTSFDIQSLGNIFYTLIGKREPQDNLSENYSQNLLDLVDQCLTLDQESRPNIEKVLRYPIVRAELDNILKDLIPLTYQYSTALSTHLVLEQVIEIQCMLAKSTDYGFTLTDESLLRVANTPNTQFLLQAELRAINQGQEYREIMTSTGSKFTGYLNNDGGLLEGVGTLIKTSGVKEYGEWHLGRINGCGKVERTGDTHWGEYKDDKREGYGIYEKADGIRYIGQFKNGDTHGYGIQRWADGFVYYGEHKNGKRDGQGYMRWPDGLEYFGEWKNSMRWGEGVIQKNGKVSSGIFEEDKCLSQRKLPKFVQQNEFNQ